jgi:hypothetical protein
MMSPRRRDAVLWAVALLTATVLLPLSQGCMDGKPSVDTSKTEATVSGTVRVKGVPAEGGTIVFNPSNSERIVAAKSAPINKDGTYTITTYTGGNQILFEGDLAMKNREIGLLREYVEVQRGTNTADFDLLGENSKKSPLPLGTQKESKSNKSRKR